MAKVTLNDISGGYASATAYNENNGLIEAAFENTLSRDGTTPNTMNADIDMNSNSLLNVDQMNITSLNATSALTLRGQAVTLATTLSGGLAASEVTYDSSDLETRLNTVFPRTDQTETITSNWTFNGDLTLQGQVWFDNLGGQDDWLGFDARDAADGDPNTKIFWDSGFYTSGYNFGMSRGIQYGGQHARTGDGAAGIFYATDVKDGEILLAVWDDTGHVAGGALTPTLGDTYLRLRSEGGVGAGSMSFGFLGAEVLSLSETGVFSFANSATDPRGLKWPSSASQQTPSTDPTTLDDYREGTYTATLTTNSGTVTLDSALDTLAYTKIGRIVFVQGKIRVTSVSTPSGVLRINVPFAFVDLGDEAEFTNSPVYTDNAVTVAQGYTLMINDTGTGLSANIEIAATGGDAGAEMQANTEMTFNFFYVTDE